MGLNKKTRGKLSLCKGLVNITKVKKTGKREYRPRKKRRSVVGRGNNPYRLEGGGLRERPPEERRTSSSDSSERKQRNGEKVQKGGRSSNRPAQAQVEKEYGSMEKKHEKSRNYFSRGWQRGA